MVKGFYSPPSRSGVSAGTVTGSDPSEDTGLVVSDGVASIRTDGETQLTATTLGVIFSCPFRSVSSVDSPVSIGLGDRIILLDSSAGPITLNLPSPSTAEGRGFIIKDKGSAAANNTTLNTPSGLIDGFASITITNGMTDFGVFSDGSNYWVIGGGS